MRNFRFDYKNIAQTNFDLLLKKSYFKFTSLSQKFSRFEGTLLKHPSPLTSNIIELNKTCFMSNRGSNYTLEASSTSFLSIQIQQRLSSSKWEN